MADNRDPNPDADNRSKLYRDFIDSLRTSPQPYFDEADLIDIFDYATDLNDDFTRIEVLSTAARLCPDSVDLAERKAFFYADLGDDEHALAVLQSIGENSVMKELLMLQLDKPDPELARRRLDALLGYRDEWDDEWLIRLADVGRRLGCFDWLIKNKEAICSHTPYPQTFVYELANIAREDGDYTTAAAMAEELTLLEPFNAEFWELLAEIHLDGMPDYDKALNAVDYALAINPDSPDALLLKADILSLTDHPMHEADPLYERALKMLPDSNDAAERYARALVRNGYSSRAASVLSEFLSRNPGWRTTLMMLLSITDGACDRDLVRRLTEADPITTTPELLRDDAANLLRHGCYNAVLMLLDSIGDIPSLSDVRPMAFEALHRAGRYEEVCRRAEAIGPDRLDEVSFYLYVLACLYTRHTDRLAADIDVRLSTPLDNGPSTCPSSLLERTALAVILPSVSKALKAGELPKAAAFDLFARR